MKRCFLAIIFVGYFINSFGSAATVELSDRLGSVRLVTDSSGIVIQSYNYDS